METPLVVGVDGSDAALKALDWAVDEAVRHGLGLRIVYAFLWARYEGAALAGSLAPSSEEALAESIVGGAAERARRRAPDVRLSTQVRPEDAAHALIAESAVAWAVVTGSRGRGGLKGLLLGSVGLSVAARAHSPVIVVRGDTAGVSGGHERILLGVGETTSGSEALRFALREAEARGCKLDAVRAWRCPAHESVDVHGAAGEAERQHEEKAERLLGDVLADAATSHPKVVVHRRTAEGPAPKVLAHRTAAADLVVVGARRRHGHLGMQLGRVSHTLLHQAQCPVAIVPDTEPGR
ncbi:universal stress protein [Actinomycetota bacterium Odt1-20B]